MVVPRWFTLNPGSNTKKWKMDSGYTYKGGYWEARETVEWEDLDDIFS